MTTLTDIAADHDRAHSPRLRDVVCVGGPLHGQRRPFKDPAQVLKTILPSNVREAWGIDKDVGDAELTRILLSEYRPDTVCIVSCGMEFRADVWR